MNSRSLCGATAVSSTNEMLLASPFIAIERPSADSRSFQMRAWSAAALARPVRLTAPRPRTSASTRSRRNSISSCDSPYISTHSSAAQSVWSTARRMASSTGFARA